MTQHLFNGETPSDKANLDANFSELYGRTNGLASGSGSVSVGGSPSSWSTAYAFEGPGGALAFGASGGSYLTQNLYFGGGVWNYKANGVGALIALTGGSFQFYGVVSGTAGAAAVLSPLLTIDASGNVGPGTDNTQKLGVASGRWSTVYAGTGTINTSDAREKTAVTPLTTAEIAAAKDLVSNIGIYQWLSAIQAKSEGDARKHVGMTVQQAIAVMTSHGLDPMAYGFICYDQWVEQKDDQGNVTLAAGDRYSFRPDELGMFIARGVAASLAAIDARLTAAGF